VVERASSASGIPVDIEVKEMPPLEVKEMPPLSGSGA